MKTVGSGVGRPSFGSRACRWRIAAPASAAAIDASAICSGVIGRYGVMVGVWIDPVTAQVMMTFRPAGAIQNSSFDSSLDYFRSAGPPPTRGRSHLTAS